MAKIAAQSYSPGINQSSPIVFPLEKLKIYETCTVAQMVAMGKKFIIRGMFWLNFTNIREIYRLF